MSYALVSRLSFGLVTLTIAGISPTGSAAAEPSSEGAGVEFDRSDDVGRTTAGPSPQTASDELGEGDADESGAASTGAESVEGSKKTSRNAPQRAKKAEKPEDDTQPTAESVVGSGADKKTVSPQAISVPSGAGTIQGMGESFSAQLSTGVATFSVPFALPKARGVQPSLGLSYSSSNGLGEAGQGWSIGVPFIARQTDRGLPGYDDRTDWHPNQDHFVFNGGQELVPICTVASGGTCSGALPGEVMPSWASGYQYFRAHVEGSFLRFFWSPDHESWIVQDKSGTTMELGKPVLSGGPATGGTVPTGIESRSVERNPDRPSEIYRWNLSRQYDQHLTSGVTGAPLNVVLYDYILDGNKAYLSDIYDSPPFNAASVAAGASAPLSDFAHHTRLVWEDRTDPSFSFRSGYRIDDTLRIARIDVTSKTTLGGVSSPRRLVRRYHLSYDGNLYRSMLVSVQVEGRCVSLEQDATAEAGNGTLPTTNCPRLPPMTFGYSGVAGYQPDGSSDPRVLPGFLPFDGRVSQLAGSPNHSIDEDLTDLFDVNADGLPDVLVTAPGLYGNGHAAFFLGDQGQVRFAPPTVMGLSGVLSANSNTLRLSNANISPQDFDGDGRINLLHMPKVKTYSAYDARYTGGQWKWIGREITTANGQSPKIDFGQDASRTQVVDVNFDGLVDVLVSTGTEYQTFLALGRYAGGDGQFGSAKWQSATAASISTTPITTCVPHSGSPVYLGESDVRFGDMNGDGLTDLVRVRKGDVQYWPGRGNGFFGTGARDDCPNGFSANRYIEMGAAPQFSDIQGSTLKLSDVNGDGLDDLLQINFDSVDIYLNINGTSWTERHILDGTPYHAGFNNRVRLTDLNGSGTPDIVWGDAKEYKLIDLAGGKKPHLLVSVENGLGKRTELEYASSSAEMLAAEARGACNATDPWAGAWCEKMPTLTHLVKKVTEFDNVTIRGRAPAAYVTEYEYRDPVFEGRQREFRGFRRARARKLGDANSPTDVSESVFLLGECLGSDGRPWNGVDQAHACAPPLRWQDNAQESLKGLPVETHKYNLSGAHHSSVYNNYTLRTLYQGRDGRAVRQAFLSESDSLLYDTTPAANGASRVRPTYPSGGGLGFADLGASVTVPTLPTPGSAVASGAPTVAYAAGMAHLRTRALVDAFGNKMADVNFGCVGGGACPTAAEGLIADETITAVTTPSLLSHPSGWLWRTSDVSVVGSRRAPARKHTTTIYDALGRPTEERAELLGTEALERTNGSSVPTGGSTNGTFTLGYKTYDAVGNIVRVRGQPNRCSETVYDSAFAVFATGESVFTGSNPLAGTGPCSGNANTTLSLAAVYDMGLGAVTLSSDYNSRNTLAVYDGFGRIVALHKPSATITGTGPTYSAMPSVLLSYQLPGCNGCASDSLPPGTRHSILRTRSQDGTDETVGEYLESYGYVDGFGRTLVTLTEADTTADGAPWIAGTLLEWDAKGAVSKKYLPFYFPGTPAAFAYETAVTTRYGRQRYDAFGRQIQTFDLDGTITLQSQYHALSTDLWDAGDLYAGPHQGTYASERKDGHGRTIQTTERYRKAGKLEERYVRTQYLPSGEPELIARVRGGPSGGSSAPVVRWMRYDTLGRMVLNAEPNTTKNFGADPYAANAGMKAWRYVYNNAGDLIGTSDARGCGQNFFYDGVGRVLGEDYAPCDAAQAAYTAASSGTDANNLEVIHYYERETLVPSGAPAGWVSGFSRGQEVATFDRGGASFVVYDGRGRVTRSLKKLPLPLTLNGTTGAPTVPGTLAGRYAARVYQRNFTYDAADRELTATTGVSELVATTGGNSSPIKDLRSGGGTPASTVNTSYSRRGSVKSVGSSYGSLVNSITRTADNLVTGITYGDIAGTQTAYLYDERRRISSVQTYRGPPPSWPSGMVATEPTQQLLLQDEDFRYDAVGNPTEIRDWRIPTDWPTGAKPVTRKVQYDDLNRATQVDYQHPGGTDAWTSPHAADSGATAPSDARRAVPNPHVSFPNRVLRQTFEYDWLGNTEKTTDDASGFYDRSLGPITQNGATNKPYQLKSATFAGTRGGTVNTLYDDAGNLTRLDLTRSGPCATSGQTCNHRYAYTWDEVGRLTRARRWNVTPTSDINAALPTTAPFVDLRYYYDSSDSRTLKEAHNATAANRRYTAYIFPTLELKRAAFTTDYEISAFTVVPYLISNGVRLGRLVYETLGKVPQVTPGTGPTQTNVAVIQAHVYLELTDHLGSASLTLDKASSELVSRTSYMAYGTTDSDYRPTRWNSFREDYKFTGKEEDAEVGLTYFGKRFLNAQLGRWISADPLAVHAPGQADLNLYAYVSGGVLTNTDPLGLEKEAPNWFIATIEAIGCFPTGCGNANAPTEDDEEYGRVEPVQTKEEMVGEVIMAAAPVPRALRKALEWLERSGAPVAAKQMLRISSHVSSRFATSIARQLVKIEMKGLRLAGTLKGLAEDDRLGKNLRDRLKSAAETILDHLTPKDLTGRIAELTGTPLVNATRKSHGLEVKEALQGLRNAIDAINSKLKHEQMRLSSGKLTDAEQTATQKLVEGLTVVRTKIQAHVDAIERVTNEAATTAASK
jgi:RHS repeat-associated protein